MTSVRVMLLSLSVCLFLGHGSAQLTFADCHSDPDNPGQPGPWSWMINDHEQDPCLLVAYLQIPCTNQPPSHQSLPPLKLGEAYTGPSEQNDCLCNTVAYSLIEACQLCQWNMTELVQPWSGYSQNCSVKTNGSFPFSFAIPIPQWAYLDVYDTDHFNVTAAQQVAEGLAFENSSSSSTSSTTATATASSSFSSSASTAAPTRDAAETDVASSGKSSNIGAIVGGVVGGALGILSLGTIVFYFAHRRRTLQRQTQSETSNRPFSTVFDESQHSLKPMSMVSPPSMIYDPNDPRTFPSFQTLSTPADMGAVPPTPSGQADGSVGGRMHATGPMQNHPASSFYGGDQDYGSYPITTYTGVPEI
ncbi:hypothetical protein K466DRAFT_655276 [Polyporus arcularius HHB13444]|uniref:Mid2 domain-containing protein n=1 Tax=Polyporus arcularius HHB13444 TaxID=1314778 RepID=A0A5C3P137_9APHY|nr:hypothetical protein K466DRAFT_655276 [Polyporus arcularius HHB13444]